MRGGDERTEGLFSYVSCEARVPATHPLRLITPHIARDDHVTKTGKRRRTSIDGRTMRHSGYAASLRIRKRIEESFGWIKTTGGLAKTRHKGIKRVGWMFELTAAAYNLVRLPKLLAEPVP